MEAIDKIIFNELASRKPIFLPEVGTLSIGRRQAETAADGVKAPVNAVAFTKGRAQDAPSVIELIEALGVEKEHAEISYGQWLSRSWDGARLEVAGVGTVDKGKFKPTEEINTILNPAAHAPVKRTEMKTENKRVADNNGANNGSGGATNGANANNGAGGGRCGDNGDNSRRGNSCLTNILLAVLIVLVSVFLGFYLCERYCGNRCGATPEVTEAQALVPAVAPQAEPEQEPEQVVPDVQKPRYHVVAGTFSQRSNADDLVKWYGQTFPEIGCELLPFKNGMTMVSIYSSESESDAHRMRNRLDRQQYNPELWVYLQQ